MKRDKSRSAKDCIKYITPSFILLSAAAAGSVPPNECRAYACTQRTPHARKRLQQSGSRSRVGIAAPGAFNVVPGGATICVNTECNLYQNEQYDGSCTGNITCRIGVRTAPALNPHHSETTASLLTDLTLALRGAHALLLTSTATSTTTAALKLAKITLHLTLTELNTVPGGLHVTAGEPITASQLTEEQRTVLINHRGLIREVLRQLKAANAEEPLQTAG